MLDVKEERRYARLRKLGQELHLPIPEHFITLEVFDKDGKLIQKHHQRSHSWTRNAYNSLFCQMASKQALDVTYEAGKLSIKDYLATIKEGYQITTTNTASLADTPGEAMRGSAAEVIVGIVVGTGTNAESFEDYVLQTPVAEGAAPDQLNYTEQAATLVSYGALVLTATLIRYINNNSGGSIGVNEVGLYCRGKIDSATARFWVQSRDLLASTVTVPDTGQLKVTYTIQLTYPS